MLTNAEMREVIEKGGTVIYRGKMYATVQSLPSDARIAADMEDVTGMIGEAERLDLESKQAAQKAALIRSLAAKADEKAKAKAEEDAKALAADAEKAKAAEKAAAKEADRAELEKMETKGHDKPKPKG